MSHDMTGARAKLLQVYRNVKGAYLTVKRMVNSFPCDKCGQYHDVDDPCEIST